MSERPGAFIQWKGTDACLDLYCVCGSQDHFDGFFAYRWRCGACGRVYVLPDRLVLTPLDGDEAERVRGNLAPGFCGTGE